MPAQGADILSDPTLAQLHRDRADSILRAAERLAARGVTFSSFLEIGAGSAQRSLALLNRYGGDGVASDINQDSLADHAHIMHLLGYARVPLLISCDAAHLPFLDDTFDFVFAYQMLHRFNDPSPVIAEAYRVLARTGHFYFDEEPTTSIVRDLLRDGRQLREPPTPAQRLAKRVKLDRVFWDEGAVDRGRWGIQVMRFRLSTWRRALRPFMPHVELTINKMLKLRTDLRPGGITTNLAGLVGGRTTGLAQKRTGVERRGVPIERLMCVDCGADLAQPTLESNLRCNACGRLYPVSGSILRLLPRPLETELYGSVS